MSAPCPVWLVHVRTDVIHSRMFLSFANPQAIRWHFGGTNKFLECPLVCVPGLGFDWFPHNETRLAYSRVATYCKAKSHHSCCSMVSVTTNTMAWLALMLSVMTSTRSATPHKQTHDNLAFYVSSSWNWGEYEALNCACFHCILVLHDPPITIAPLFTHISLPWLVDFDAMLTYKKWWTLLITETETLVFLWICMDYIP